MFDIVLGAAAGCNMAEVQLFVHYLNLQTVAKTRKEEIQGRKEEQKTIKNKKGKEKRKRKEQIFAQVNKK